MSYSNNDDKKSSGLFITKMAKNFQRGIGLAIYNINDLTDDELKNLIQNFFENNYGYEDSNKYQNKERIYTFIFESNLYRIILIGEENGAKKSLIKFLNFLKNIMVEDFYCYDFDYGYDVDIINLIGEVIKNSKIIKGVFLKNNLFKSNDSFEILHMYLKNHKSLTRLYFGSPIDKLSTKNIGLLVDVIKSSTIEYIDGLHENDYNLIFENLMNNSMSKNHKIKCVGKSLNDDLVLKLSNMIIDKNINYLKEINFSFNNITSKRFSILVDSLLKSNNKDIIEINFRHNKLDDDCIEKLGELIKKNENIKDIDLTSNQITNKGVEKLCEYIAGNISIESINLCNNLGITNSSFKTIKYMINSSIVSSLDIGYTEISEGIAGEIRELLKIPIEKREIPLITIEDVKSASKRMKE